MHIDIRPCAPYLSIHDCMVSQKSLRSLILSHFYYLVRGSGEGTLVHIYSYLITPLKHSIPFDHCGTRKWAFMFGFVQGLSEWVHCLEGIK
jgi:hypothetical protein